MFVAYDCKNGLKVLVIVMLINFSVSVVDSEPTCENTSSDSQIYYSESGCSLCPNAGVAFPKIYRSNTDISV